MKFKEVKKILIENGWIHVRTNGSHYQFKKDGVNFLATVPFHSGKSISIGVIKNLEKGTNLSILNR